MPVALSGTPTVAAGILRHGIDLNQRAIVFDEDAIELGDDIDGLFSLITLKANEFSHAFSLLMLDAVHDVNGLCDQCLGGVPSHLLNIHASLGAGQHHRTSILAVHEDGKVVLTP